MGDHDVFGNVILLTPKEHADAILEEVVPGRDGKVVSGASRLPNDAGLIFKVLGPESEPVKAKVRDFWALVRKAVLDTTIPPVRCGDDADRRRRIEGRAMTTITKPWTTSRTRTSCSDSSTPISKAPGR